MMTPKRRLLTLIFACLCFKNSLLIKYITITATTIITITVAIAMTITIVKLTPPTVNRSFSGHFIQSKRYVKVTLRYLMSILSECFERCVAH